MAMLHLSIEKAYGDGLKDLAESLSLYEQVHPIPANADVECRIFRSKDQKGEKRVNWSWQNVIIDDTSRSVWQGLCDSWLKRRYGNEFGHDVFCVDLVFCPCKSSLDAQGNDGLFCYAQRIDKDNEKMIEGDGLIQSFEARLPRFKFEDLIVDDGVRNRLIMAKTLIEKTSLIYNDWGFCEIDAKPRTVLNFFGAPGTGKTMAAHGLAAALGKKILIANFAEIESKYVGDSPKNLENLFRAARNNDALLFFDEADSFLGKRITSVMSSSDQAVNSLRSKLLQLIEDHTGVIVFCTNLLCNYDRAFESRILINIKFDLPDDEIRRRLILQKIPKKLPFETCERIDEKTLITLVEISKGFSGRDIKNAVLQTLCSLAAAGRDTFRAEDFVVAFREYAREKEHVAEEHGELSDAEAGEVANDIKNNLDNHDYTIVSDSNLAQAECDRSVDQCRNAKTL